MYTCTINKIELSFDDRGTGPVLLLVHGFPLDYTMWQVQIDALSARYRVIAPDLRGFGQSGVSHGVVTMKQLADDLAALLDYLSIREPIVLCGLSMGGYIALEFWHNFASRLRGLILCDTRAANDSPEAAANRSTLAQRVLSEGVHGIADTMIPKLFSQCTLQNNPSFIDATRQVIEHTKPHGIASAALGMAQRTDFTAELPRIECPTLVIVGQFDAISPASEMQQMAQAIPNAQFTIVNNAGHMTPLEQPDAVNAAIEEFLQRI